MKIFRSYEEMAVDSFNDLLKRLGFKEPKAVKYEAARLQTFRNWPKPFIKIRELARNGFIYKGCSDIVVCGFCHVKLYDWYVEDDIESEHRKYAPTCPFLNGKEVGNIPYICKKKLSLQLNEKTV